jgi:hypothetical protein
MICKIRSTELESVWLNIRADDRPSVHIGDRYGKLLVEHPHTPDHHGHPRWFCRCECGKAKIIRGASLLSGNTTSCGCEERKRNDLLESSACRRETVNSENIKTAIFPSENIHAETIDSKIDAPGSVRHAPAMGNESKDGKAIDIQVLFSGEQDDYSLFLTGICSICGSKVRFGKHDYRECENDLCGNIGLYNPLLNYSTSEFSPDQIKSATILFEHLNPKDSFGKSPEPDTAKFILHKEINMSDYVDMQQGEWGSAPARCESEWNYIKEHGFAPGCDVSLHPRPLREKGNWWDYRQLPASEVIQYETIGKEYTMYDGQLIEAVDNFLEKVLANMHRPR